VEINALLLLEDASDVTYFFTFCCLFTSHIPICCIFLPLILRVEWTKLY